MIHEATGKFSSRCVLPDLRSLALLIELLLRHWSCAGGAERPHIGEYAGKTNAFAGCKGCNPPSIEGAGRKASGGRFARKRRLLAVVLQHLVAGCRDLGAVLLQAGEDREVTLVDDGAAVALDVAV